jgi:hypothetical protein
LESGEDFYRGEDVSEKIAPRLSDTLVKIDYSIAPVHNQLMTSPTKTSIPSTVEQGVKVDSPSKEVPKLVEQPTVAIPPSPTVKSKSVSEPIVNKESDARPRRSTSKAHDYSKLASKGTTGSYVADGEDYGHVFQMTLMKALHSEHADAAREAAKKELKQLVNLGTWVYLKDPRSASESVHTKETPCSMFLKPKYNARGEFTLWKARLVDGGHMTDPLRYEPMEKTAPTTTLEVVMFLLAMAAAQKLEIEGFDVPSAYLNASLKVGHFHKMRISKRISKLLVEVDPKAREFVQKDGSVLVEIRKSLYGLPEAAQLWYEYLKGALLDGRYTQCPYDPCLFIRRKSTTEVSIIAIYVDDCLHIYRGEGIKKELYASLARANLKDLKMEQLTAKTPISFLGLNIMRRGPQLIFVNQKGYLQSLLDEYEEDIESVPRSQSNPCDEDIFRPTYTGEDL